MACLARAEEILAAKASQIAAVIIEPLVQGAAGILTMPKGFLKGLREITLKHDILLITDEVATGFGRTGTMFACEQESVIPDLLCLAKGITGGYLPLAATACTQTIYEAFLGEYDEFKAFFHGHSYTANPLACACALECLNLFDADNTLENLAPQIEMLAEWLKKVQALPHVGDARGRGVMAGVELVSDKVTKKPYPPSERIGYRVTLAAREKGVWLRPLGDTIVIMPPLSITRDEMHLLLQTAEEAITSVTESSGS